MNDQVRMESMICHTLPVGDMQNLKSADREQIGEIAAVAAHRVFLRAEN